MSNKLNDPFDELVLDDEEQAVEDAIERGEFEENPDSKTLRKCRKKLHDSIDSSIHPSLLMLHGLNN
jgi:hypothetical protein